MDANILKYQVFLRVVEKKTLSAAAQSLGYTQSAVSKMIGDLEKSFNAKLLDRSKKGARLTTEGELLLPEIMKLTESYQRLESLASSIHMLEAGRIRIGAFSSVATHVLPEVIYSYRRRYPKVDYEILMGDYEEIYQWIETARVDLGFLPKYLPQNGMEVIHLFDDEYKVVLPKGHVLARKPEISLEEIAEYPFIMLERGGGAEVAKIFSANHIHPQSILTTWDDYAIMSMVERGLAISILPSLILRRCAYGIEIRDLKARSKREICVSYKEPLSRAASTFLRILELNKPKQSDQN